MSIAYVFMRSCTYVYLHSWLGTYKTVNISETVEDRATLPLTTYIKSYPGFRLPPKCMTLDNLCTRFKVIDSLNAAKMAKYSLVMTTPFRVAGCIISSLLGLRIHAHLHLLTYLQYIHRITSVFGDWPVI